MKEHQQIKKLTKINTLFHVSFYDVVPAVGGPVHVGGADQGLGIVEPVVTGLIFLGVERHLNRFKRFNV